MKPGAGLHGSGNSWACSHVQPIKYVSRGHRHCQLEYLLRPRQYQNVQRLSPPQSREIAKAKAFRRVSTPKEDGPAPPFKLSALLQSRRLHLGVLGVGAEDELVAEGDALGEFIVGDNAVLGEIPTVAFGKLGGSGRSAGDHGFGGQAD